MKDSCDSAKHINISLKNIIITCRIKDAVRKYNPNFDFDDFIIQNDDTLPLGRMEQMMDDKIYNTKDRPPIDVSEGYRYFNVINGRHRVVRALLLGYEYILAKVV